MRNIVASLLACLGLIHGTTSQSCYNGADPCSPQYPCPVNEQTPHGVDCESYYQCVAPYDWVSIDNGCGVGEHFDPYQCSCVTSGNPCTSLNDLCPGGVTIPPFDHGITAAPCAPSGDCDVLNADVPDVYTCSRYFTCTLNTWVEQTCQEGDIFDPNPGQGCVRATPTNLGVCADNECRGPVCYGGADPCKPVFPCPIGIQVPSATDCQSYYQCVTSYDWVYLSNGCQGFGDFDVKLCSCRNGVTCSEINDVCPGGVTTPPVPGIAAEPCYYAPCNSGSLFDIPDMHTCSRYMHCDNGFWQAMSCAEGAIFDPNQNTCVSATNGNLDVCNNKFCSETTEQQPDVTSYSP